MEMDLVHTPTMVFKFRQFQSFKQQLDVKMNQFQGNTTSPMLFEMGSQATGVICQLEMTFDCWQDWPMARDNRQVTFLAPTCPHSTKTLLAKLD